MLDSNPYIHFGHDFSKMDLPSRGIYGIYVVGDYSSALNPLIYGVFNKNSQEFRKNYLKVLRCRNAADLKLS